MLAELERLLATLVETDGGKAKAKGDAEASPRSCILDGSPKSFRPTDFGCEREIQHVALPCIATPPPVRTPGINTAMSPIMADSMVRIPAAQSLLLPCVGCGELVA